MTFEEFKVNYPEHFRPGKRVDDWPMLQAFRMDLKKENIESKYRDKTLTVFFDDSAYKAPVKVTGDIYDTFSNDTMYWLQTDKFEKSQATNTPVETKIYYTLYKDQDDYYSDWHIYGSMDFNLDEAILDVIEDCIAHIYRCSTEKERDNMSYATIKEKLLSQLSDYRIVEISREFSPKELTDLPSVADELLAKTIEKYQQAQEAYAKKEREEKQALLEKLKKELEQ